MMVGAILFEAENVIVSSWPITFLYITWVGIGLEIIFSNILLDEW